MPVQYAQGLTHNVRIELSLVPQPTANIASLSAYWHSLWAPLALTVRPVTQDDGFGTYTHIPVRRIIAD